MRTLKLPAPLAVGVVTLGAFSWSSYAQPPPAPPPPPCPANDAAFVCTGAQMGPEDLLALDERWLVVSSMSGEGGLALIRASDRTFTKAYPSASSKARLDAKTYADCPGPPTPGKLTTHGLYARPGRGPVHRVLAVGHGERESIEVFDVDVRGATPQVAWVGCVIAPDPIGLNSVIGLPDGGFITSNFLARGNAESRAKLLAGEPNGELWEWHPGGTWQKVPGSESSGPNGLEISDDGRTLYVAAWGSQSFLRLSRGASKVERDEVPLGFRVDNVHFARDGSLVAVGQGTGGAAQQWLAVTIDPRTLAVREVLRQSDVPGFGAGTVVAELDGRWWVGSFRGDRVAIVPAPR